MIAELSRVVLTTDLPEHDLRSGDLGTVVLVHGDGAGYEVEFVTLDGETLTVVTLARDPERPVRYGEIAHMRMGTV
jgi:hypothetical protein